MCTSPLKKTHQIYTNLKNCLDLCQKKTEIGQNTENFHPCMYIIHVPEYKYGVRCILLVIFIIISELLFNNITVLTMSTSPAQDQ